MTQETWLLTGGAGYIGSHIADEFIRAGEAENGLLPKKSPKKAEKA